MNTMAQREFFGVALDDPAEDQVVDRAAEVFTMMRPRPCPFPMRRIGPDKDGGYLVPDDLEEIVACFSPGVSNRKEFEDELAENHGIRSHLCDYSSDADQLRTPLRDGQTFMKKWLDVEGVADSISLERWVDDLEPEGDLLLQIDIEGAEYRNLLSCPEATLSRFRIIVIEFHRLHLLRDPAVTQSVLHPFFKKLSSIFSPVHAHPNNTGRSVTVALDTEVSVPSTLEMTWLRKDRMERSTARLIPPMLPHPLDISFNVRRHPPVFLSDEWVIGERSTDSVRKMELMIRSWARWVSAQERQPV